MKRMVAVMACSFLMITNLYAADSVAQREAAKISQDVGRYQLFQGQYTIYDLKRGASTTSTVFLIDSATGVVRRYFSKIDDDGKNVEGWVTTDISFADKKK